LQLGESFPRNCVFVGGGSGNDFFCDFRDFFSPLLEIKINKIATSGPKLTFTCLTFSQMRFIPFFG
jgi:hypothetical protein